MGLGDFNIVSLNTFSNATMTLVREVIRELADTFPDRYFHLGVDEVESKCMHEFSEVQRQIREAQSDTRAVLQEFVANMVHMLRTISKTPIMWEDGVDINSAINRSDRAVVQTWKGWAGACCGKSLAKKLISADVAPVIQSSGLYMDWEHSAMKMLTDSNNILMEPSPLNMGIEMCVWTEQIDATNLDCRIWPRGSTIAEMAWTGSRRRGPPSQQNGACIQEADCQVRWQHMMERLQAMGVRPAEVKTKDQGEACPKLLDTESHHKIPTSLVESLRGGALTR